MGDLTEDDWLSAGKDVINTIAKHTKGDLKVSAGLIGGVLGSIAVASENSREFIGAVVMFAAGVVSGELLNPTE